MKKIKWFWVLMICMLSACAHVKEQKSFEKLDAQQKLFMKAMRWKSYETAASVIRFKNPARRLAPIDDLSKITITSYDLVGSMPNFEEGTAVAYVLFDYIQDDTGRVYSIKHTQNWWFDEESKRWYLASDMPSFKLN
ncbi:MAG: hypothetical protein A6F70_02645 [Cycloclasticus sp. symbiont of Bathymodiolus heckerae]|nr:MAG: hypothetical protein A6F70_02645 [Cycloclasticus sp. symbiont of Bathymodiolus heckerae]